MKVSILIPVYNEFLTLPLVVQRVLAAPLPEGCEKEVVIVDDGSTDGTTELLAQYQDSPLVVVHHSIVNFGKGAALRIGIAKSTGDILLVQDGDLEYDPRDYLKLLEPLASGRAKIVYGSRFKNRVRGMRLRNRVANKALTWAANLLYRARLTDEATAYKAFAREVIDAVDLRCVRFEFCPEITAKARRLGYEIAEVPISYNPRGILEGKKIRWQDGVEALWTLVKYRVGSARSFEKPPAPALLARRASAQQ
jgi:glycosyltransferase involved in cell wall biosynthesis